jgi:signal transduction histidine kinase
MLMIMVEDSGTGIDDEEKSKIFDVYFRGRNSQETAGDGIGLYVVKENLEKIGGTIKVESVAGEGSKFIIALPVISLTESADS